MLSYEERIGQYIDLKFIRDQKKNMFLRINKFKNRHLGPHLYLLALSTTKTHTT